jgi:preprotein translocase subunit YajC
VVAVMSFMLSQNSLSLMAQGTGGIMAFAPLLIIMVIFYVLLILPAQKRQKKTQEMLTALKNGDKIVTTGGMFGTIVGLEGDSIQLRIADQVKVKVLRSAVASLQPESKEE